jgi:hypothetical protein
MAWLSGFFSATNWWVTDEQNEIRNDSAAIDVWLRKWCEQNPTKLLIEAASALHGISARNTYRVGSLDKQGEGAG